MLVRTGTGFWDLPCPKGRLHELLPRLKTFSKMPGTWVGVYRRTQKLEPRSQAAAQVASGWRPRYKPRHRGEESWKPSRSASSERKKKRNLRPNRKNSASIGRATKRLVNQGVQAFIAQPAVKAFQVAILGMNSSRTPHSSLKAAKVRPLNPAHYPETVASGKPNR